MNIAEAEKNLISQILPLYEEAEAKTIAIYAMEHVCGLRKGQLLFNKQKQLNPQEETALQFIIEELVKGKPIQYILGETEFYGFRLMVNPSVLIPRPETEELVDWILKEVDAEQSLKILDIGTGSGCIPIALKKKLPDAEIWAMDISVEALETAKKNALLNQTEVKFIQGDVLNLAFQLQPSTFNLIVSNPPYITGKEKKEMHQNVVEHEPHTALFVPDENPLLFYDRIADFAKTHLKQGGLLFFEINEHFGAETMALLQNKGYKQNELRKDLMRKDRMLKAVSLMV